MKSFCEETIPTEEMPSSSLHAVGLEGGRKVQIVVRQILRVAKLSHSATAAFHVTRKEFGQDRQLAF